MTEKMKQKAGPPVCSICGSIKEAWIRKFPKTNGHRGLVWLCPNFCEIRRNGEQTE